MLRKKKLTKNHPISFMFSGSDCNIILRIAKEKNNECFTYRKRCGLISPQSKKNEIKFKRETQNYST